MGYKHGVPTNGKSMTKPNQVGGGSKKGINERYIAWCDHPEEAYRAIRDALFRPTIEMTSARSNMAELISIKVKAPFKTKRSYLTIQCERTEQPWVESGGQYVRIKPDPCHPSKIYREKKETISYVENRADLNKGIPGNRSLKDLKEDPPGTFHLSIVNHSESTVIVKVQLRVTDDGDFVIPYEPVFDDAGELHWVAKKGHFFNTSSNPSSL
jgi:hypothetical protein